MTSYDVAHIREQGEDLVIIFVSNDFGYIGDTEQSRQMVLFQRAANSARLEGNVVLVWENGFRAPRGYHSYFESVPYNVLLSNINKTLTF